MIIVLFHVLYLLGKFVYQNYRVNKQKVMEDDTNEEKKFVISKEDYKMYDAEASDDDDDRKPIKFFPPAYVQRYVAVSNILTDAKYHGKIRKVVDFGCSELGFLIYLKNVPDIEEILCVDIDRPTLENYKDRGAPLVTEYISCRKTPLVIEICEGSVTSYDKKLEKTDAVICIELIEHLYPDTLTDLPFNIFGCIKPKLVIITTPNADFNVLFPNFRGFRHPDHKFEWTREQFQDWAKNITERYSDYEVTFDGICKGPEGTEHLGACTQMAVFHCQNEKDIQPMGIQGLFETVALHEYPFKVDNRSDEQKILDEAEYYIRHLSFRDEEMMEEVPLMKLLEILGKFNITVEAFKTVLEEAGWSITDRDAGPVVLVPQYSTFSDISVTEHVVWDNPNFTTDDEDEDEDGWDGEAGPPVNRNEYALTSYEDWNVERWEDEPSIVIPHNNSVTQDNTYLFDGETISDELECIPESDENFETLQHYTEVSYQRCNSIKKIDAVQQLPNDFDCASVNNTDGSNDSTVPPLDLNASVVSSDSSLNAKLQEKEEDFSFDGSDRNTSQGTISNIAQRLNRMFDFRPYLSVSRSSTSPDSFLPQSQFSKNDSICNRSMICDQWTLTSSFDELDISNETRKSVKESDTETVNSSKEEDNNLLCMYLNTSYNENTSSDFELLSSSSKITRSSSVDEAQSVQKGSNASTESQMNEQLQTSSSRSLTSLGSGCISDHPQFTSSPKIDVKLNTTGGKRRSTNNREKSNISSAIKQLQVELSSKNPLESISELTPQSNSNISISIASTDSYSAAKNWSEDENAMYERNIAILPSECNAADKSSSSSLVESDTSTIGCTLMNEKQMAEESRTTNCLNSDEYGDKIRTRQVECSTTGTRNQESLCDMQLPLRQSSSDNTETRSELRTLEGVNNTESSNNYTKDFSNLKEPSLALTANDENASNVQSTSVLKIKEQIECIVQTYELQCKDENVTNTLEAVESTDLKLTSPEAVETPPISWSPEIMDSGYPNSASAPDMTPEYDLSSIAQDHISDPESPSIAEAPRLGILEVVEVENGDLANNNRDDEGNNMVAAELNDLDDLQPLIDVLENDLENENDIYALENDFPIWLLRILEMANPVDLDMQANRDNRELALANEIAGGEARYDNADRDEGVYGSSSENDSDLENNEMENDDDDDVNENAIANDAENVNENSSNSNSGSDRWATGDT